MAKKVLYRSKESRVIAGVCGGIGEYLNIDPTIIRLLFIITALFGGFGILAYVICWVIIPDEKNKKAMWEEWTTEDKQLSPEARRNSTMIGGLILIFFGTMFLMTNLGIWTLNWSYAWPVILIIIGAIILISRRKSK